jgi:hypothetical protein
VGGGGELSFQSLRPSASLRAAGNKLDAEAIWLYPNFWILKKQPLFHFSVKKTASSMVD